MLVTGAEVELVHEQKDGLKNSAESSTLGENK